MRRIASVASDRLRWTQPHLLGREYELRRGDERVATLAFRTACGSLAAGESADGRWTFKRVGFWRARATVRADGEETNLAVFENNTWSNGGTLRLVGGKEILATTNFWQTKWQFQTLDEVALVRFETDGLLRFEAGVEIQPAAAGLADLPWLVMFGWYLVVLFHQDGAATVAVMG